MRLLGTPASISFPRDSLFGSIALDPELVVDDVNVYQTAMNATDSLPADEHQQIMIAIAIEDGLEMEVAMGIGNLGIVNQDPLDQRSIGFCGIHCRMVSDCRSNTIKRMR